MFPFVGSTAEGGAGTGTTNCGPGTTANMPMPTGIAAGDLLIALVCSNFDSDTIADAANGWTALGTTYVTRATFGTTAALYKIAAGSDVLSMARANSANFSWSVYRIPASCWHGTTVPEGVGAAFSGGQNPDCPNLDPAGWGAEDTLWIAGLGWKSGSAWTGFTFPPNYTKDQTYAGASGNATYGRAIMAARELNAASEDPGSFNTNAGGGFAVTIAVRPKASGNVEKKFWLVDSVPTGATAHRTLLDREHGNMPTPAMTGTGWVAGNKAAGQSVLQHGGAMVALADGGWGTTLQPNAGPSATLGDGWRSDTTINGTFANSDWHFWFGLLGATTGNSYTGRVKLAVRLWRGTDANGVGATEITAGRVASSATTATISYSSAPILSGLAARLEWTWSPGGTVTLSNEYLWATVGVEVTAAGGTTTQDFAYRISSNRLLTPVFTPGGGTATATTLTGPTSGPVNGASTNFVIGVDAPTITGTVVVTPATDVSAGGTFSPTSVNLTTGSPSATVTFTAAKAGIHNITTTNDGGLTDPAAVVYRARPEVTVVLGTAPDDSTPRANLSSLKWAWFDSVNPGSFSAPTDKGTAETTDGSGNLVISLPNSLLANGEIGWLIVSDSDGTVDQSPPGKSFSGPVAVT